MAKIEVIYGRSADEDGDDDAVESVERNRVNVICNGTNVEFVQEEDGRINMWIGEVFLKCFKEGGVSE